MPHRPTLVTAVSTLVSLTLVGTLGYMAIAGMGFVDALLHDGHHAVDRGLPRGATARPRRSACLPLMILGGLGIVFYSGSIIARDLIEGELQRSFGRRKVQRQIVQMADHIE